jgi:hypothetical protein
VIVTKTGIAERIETGIRTGMRRNDTPTETTGPVEQPSVTLARRGGILFVSALFVMLSLIPGFGVHHI